MRYIIFSRVSDDKQLDESQLFKCREYVDSVKKPGDEVIEFNEPPTSTRLKMHERPTLMAMLEFTKKNDMLVVFCVSRIARTGTEIVKIYEDEVTNKKVLWHSINQPKLDKTFIHLYAMFGEMTRDIISANTKAGLKRKQAAMHKVGTAWFGYKTDENRLQTHEDSRAFGKPYLLIPDEHETRAIEEMKALREQGFPYEAIAKRLASKGYKNRKGNPIQPMTVFRVLRRLGKQNPAPKAEAIA